MSEVPEIGSEAMDMGRQLGSEQQREGVIVSDDNERPGASAGSVTSAFGDWFDAQFPPMPGKLSDKTIEELLDLVAVGSLAQNELEHRQDRRNMEQAALSAWMARQAMEVPRE